jgi:hypothetical protein
VALSNRGQEAGLFHHVIKRVPPGGLLKHAKGSFRRHSPQPILRQIQMRLFDFVSDFCGRHVLGIVEFHPRENQL